MENEFIPYTEALALKELGFDEPCLDFYDDAKELFYNHENKEKIYIGDSVKAPLYQQVFRWFREKIIFRIGEYRTKTGERFTIVTINDANFKEEYLTYEEAELECLKKLIEIIKNNK